MNLKINEFKNKPFIDRHNFYIQLSQKYPKQIKIIINSQNLKINKFKYLVDPNITIGQLLFILRKNNKINYDESLYLFTENNQIICSASLLVQIADEQSNKDGFLYLYIEKQNSFG